MLSIAFLHIKNKHSWKCCISCFFSLVIYIYSFVLYMHIHARTHTYAQGIGLKLRTVKQNHLLLLICTIKLVRKKVKVLAGSSGLRLPLETEVALNWGRRHEQNCVYLNYTD